MLKLALIILALIAFGHSQSASASVPTQAPQSGFVCQPKGVDVKHDVAIVYNADWQAVSFIRLNRSHGRVRLAKNTCVEYAAGTPVRFVRHTF